MSLADLWSPTSRSNSNLFAGALVSGFNPAMGSYLAHDEDMRANEYAMNQQHEWTREENELNRSFQREMFALENAEWLRRFNIQNDYSAQAARLRAAGINPATVFGNSDMGVPSVQSAQPNVGGNSPGYGGFGSIAGGSVGGAGAFTTLAQLLDSYTNWRAQNQSEERQKATLGAEVEKMYSEIAKNNSDSQLQVTINSIKSAFGSSREGAEIAKLVSSAYADYAQGDLADAQSKVAKAIERVNNAEASIKEESKPFVLSNLKAENDRIKSEVEKNRSQSALNVSNTRYLNSLRETENQLRDYKVTAAELQNAFSSLSYIMLERQNGNQVITNDWQIQSIIESVKNQGLINDELEQKVRQMVMDNDTYALRMFFNNLESATRSIGNYGGVLNFAQRNQIQSRMTELMNQPVRTEFEDNSGYRSSSYRSR